MIAAAMKPPCKVVDAEQIAARTGPKSPLPGTYPEKPSDYGLNAWLKPGDEGVDPEKALRFTCADLNVIKRAAVAEIKRRIADREAEGKGGMTPDEEAILLEAEEKPYPNEHACRLQDPGKFESDSFRRVKREHQGKPYYVIMGRLRGESALTEQAYRYPKDKWTAEDARKHCDEHNGIEFAAATGREEAIDIPPAETAEQPDVYHELMAVQISGDGDVDWERMIRRVLRAWKSGVLSEDESVDILLLYMKSGEAEIKKSKDAVVAKLAELAAKVVKKSGGDRWKT